MAQEMDGGVSGAQEVEEPTNRRSRARRNVIGGSPHRDEYVRMLENGVSSTTLERYAFHRYGEEIPASTFRTYRRRSKIEVKKSPWAEILKEAPEGVLDVLSLRAEMITMQRARIMIDAKHEQDMTKLFGTTRGEMAELGRMLDAYKGDLQDLGLMPKAGQSLEVTGSGGAPLIAAPVEGVAAPKARTLGDLLGVSDPEVERQMARTLHLVSKQAEAQEEAG